MNHIRHFLPRFGGAPLMLKGPGLLVLRVLLALAILLPISPSRAYSPAEDTTALPTWIKQPVDAPPYFRNMTDRSLAIHPPSGTPCIAYGADSLYYSCMNPTTNVWTTQTVDSNLQVGEYAALDYNSYGWPFITYYDASRAQLKLAYHNGAGWVLKDVPNVNSTSLVPAANPQASAQDAQLSTDENGKIRPPTESVAEIPASQVTYVDPQETAPDHQTGATDGPAVQPPAPEAVDAPTPQPDALPTDQPAAEPTAQPDALPTETQVAPPDDGPSMLDRIQEVLQPWLQPNDPTFPFESEGYGKFTSIAIDGRDGIHITYHDEIDGSLEYIYWDGITWWGAILDDPDDQGDVGLWTSVAVDYFYNVYIAYYDDKYDNLKFAFIRAFDTPNPTLRVTLTLVDGDGTQVNIGPFSSIALEWDLTGDNEKTFAPHISYYDFSNDSLKHAWRTYDTSTRKYTWHTQVVEGGSTKKNIGWYTSIAVDGNDVVHISYFDVGNGNLKYARKSGTSSWTLFTLDATGSTLIGLFTSITIDSLQRPCISYLHATAGELRMVCRTNTNLDRWTLYPVRTIGHDVGISTSLAIDEFGTAHISYMDTTAGILKYARSGGPHWFLTTFALPHSGQYSAIDARQGLPSIAYNEQGEQEVMFARLTGAGWGFSPVDTTYQMGQYVSMELEPVSGRPHISYYDATHKELIYATPSADASRWVTTTVDIEGSDVGWYSSLALSSDNRPFISYYDAANGWLKMIARTGTGTWRPDPVDTSVGKFPEEGVGWYSSIDVDRFGNPHIAYYDMTYHRLKYAYWSNGVYPGSGSWQITELDNSSTDVGRFSSLVVDPNNDARHICYYDYTNGNLKYARWTTGAGWEFQVVDGTDTDGDGINEGDVGLYCSIDLSPAGDPVISYYDNSHGDLKVASSYALPALPVSLFMPLIRR